MTSGLILLVNESAERNAAAQVHQTQEIAESRQAVEESGFGQRDTVHKLIDLLDSSRRVERVAAEQKLFELGVGALPWLPPVEQVKSATVREALDRVRTKLEEAQARDSAQATRLELIGRRSVLDWAREITRQTGNRVLLGDLPPAEQNRDLELNLEAAAFWTNFDRFVSDSGLAWTVDAGQSALVLARPVASGRPNAPRETVVYSGVHRIEVETAQFRPRQKQPPLLRVTLSVASEPRLRHLLFQFDADSQQVFRIGAGEPRELLPPFESGARIELPPGGGFARVHFDFVCPEGRLPETVRLEGEMIATVAALNLPVRFSGLRELADRPGSLSIRRQRGGVQVMLDRVRLLPAEDGSLSAVVQVAAAFNKGGKAFESHRAWILHNDAWLESRSGTRIIRESASEPTFQADGAVGMSYRFAGLAAPWEDDTFVYEAPALIVDLPVKFAVEFAPPMSETSRGKSAAP